VGAPTSLPLSSWRRVSNHNNNNSDDSRGIYLLLFPISMILIYRKWRFRVFLLLWVFLYFPLPWNGFRSKKDVQPQENTIHLFTDEDLPHLNRSTHVVFYYAPDCPISRRIFRQYERLVNEWKKEYSEEPITFAMTDGTKSTQLGALVRLRSFPLFVV
jgi:hypothetical protein